MSKGKSGWGTLLDLGVMLGKAAYEESQVKKISDTEDYQEELKNNIEELDKQTDLQLLKDFHYEYDDRCGRGLFTVDAGNRMDPMFMAYVEVFKKRGFKKLEARCNSCEKILGYRMSTADYGTIRDEYSLTHGDCECRCGKRKTWSIECNYMGEPDLYVRNDY